MTLVTPNPRLLVLAIAAVVVAGVAPAFAQATGSAPPSNGLFGGGTSDAKAGQTLNLTLALSSAYDGDASVEAGPVVNQLLGPVSTAYSTLLDGSAQYGWQGRAVQVRATGASTLRHDRFSREISGGSQEATAGLNARLPWRTTLSASQTATYSPSYPYLYGVFPRVGATGLEEAPAAAPDSHASDFQSYYAYGTQMTLAHAFTRRSSVSAIADRYEMDYRGKTTGQPELDSYGMTGLFTQQVSRTTNATARYRYRSGSFAFGSGAATTAISTETGTETSAETATSTEHGVEIGVGHTWRLSGARRITFDVGLGSSVVMPRDPPVGVSDRGRASRLTGQVGLAYLFGRTWKAGASYHQGVDYVPGLTEPVSTDGVTARIDGLITRRIDVLVSADYASGESALSRNTPIFDTYTGSARLRYALARTLAVYVGYLYYFHDFRGNMQLAPGMPQSLERSSVRAGLTLLVPALGR